MGLKWDILIDGEEKRMASFYRLANMFTDVPQLKATVKRRKWLDILINRIAFAEDKTYLYLFFTGIFARIGLFGAFYPLNGHWRTWYLFYILWLGQLLLSVLFYI